MSMTDSTSGLDDEQLEMVYGWVDQVPLSRPKKNIARDFSDGVLVAEMIQYYFPRLVELHNYTASNNTRKKTENWSVLNRKVFKKLQFELADDVIENLVKASSFTIEKVLMDLKTRIDFKLKADRLDPPPPISSFRAKESDQPEADQHIGSKRKGPKGKNPPSKASMEVPLPPFERVNHKNLGRSDPVMPGSLARLPAGGSKKDRDLTIMYEEKEQECLAKGETIAILLTKVRHLENLVYLREVRTSQLEKAISDFHRGVYEFKK